MLDFKKSFVFRMTMLVLVGIITVVGCTKEESTKVTQGLDCSNSIPFYELQDTSTKSLFVDCDCLNEDLDLGSVLMEYNQAESFDFSCNEVRFNQIPSMPSVEKLVSNVTTSNVLAFPNLKEYRNRSYSNNLLADQLDQLPKLTHVVLLNAMSFPKYFMENRTLEVFKMTYTDTQEQSITLPSNLSTLSTLKELDIVNINLALFTNFDKLEALEHLKVIDASIGRIPQTTNQWPELKSLELSNVNIRGAGHIPDVFEQMNNLELVYIGETRVTTTAQINIYKAPNLKELTFSFCELTDIQDGIGGLTTLEKLIIQADLSNTVAPIALPQSLGTLTNLKSIFLSTGSLEFPAQLFGLKSTLESLAISDDIGFVPEAIGEFSMLKELSLANCGLSGLPSSIQNLSNTLISLDLSNNTISESTKQQLANWLPTTQIVY